MTYVVLLHVYDEGTTTFGPYRSKARAEAEAERLDLHVEMDGAEYSVVVGTITSVSRAIASGDL